MRGKYLIHEAKLGQCLLSTQHFLDQRLDWTSAVGTAYFAVFDEYCYLMNTAYPPLLW
jgi:hypothetical protein